MKSNKRGFWLLAIISFLWSFSVWGLLLVNYTLAPEQGHHSSMVGSSMSAMMKQHTQLPVTLGELLRNTEGAGSIQNSGEGHHPASGIMGTVHNLTTLIIYMVCPIIFGGTVFLLIGWVFS